MHGRKKMQPRKIALRHHTSHGPVGYRLKRDTKKSNKIKSKDEDDGK